MLNEFMIIRKVLTNDRVISISVTVNIRYEYTISWIFAEHRDGPEARRIKSGARPKRRSKLDRK